MGLFCEDLVRSCMCHSLSQVVGWLKQGVEWCIYFFFLQCLASGKVSVTKRKDHIRCARILLSHITDTLWKYKIRIRFRLPIHCFLLRSSREEVGYTSPPPSLAYEPRKANHTSTPPHLPGERIINSQKIRFDSSFSDDELLIPVWLSGGRSESVAFSFGFSLWNG